MCYREFIWGPGGRHTRNMLPSRNQTRECNLLPIQKDTRVYCNLPPAERQEFTAHRSIIVTGAAEQKGCFQCHLISLLYNYCCPGLAVVVQDQTAIGLLLNHLELQELGHYIEFECESSNLQIVYLKDVAFSLPMFDQFSSNSNLVNLNCRFTVIFECALNVWHIIIACLEQR